MKQLNVFRIDEKSMEKRNNYINMEDGDAMHKFLTASIGSQRHEADLLYRIIYTKDSAFLYVSSNKDCSVKFIESFGFVFVKEINLEKHLADKAEGDKVTFDIKLLPYKRHHDDFIYIRSPEERMRWVKEKLSKCGIDVQTIMEKELDKLYHKRSTGHIKISANVYTGIAKITNKDALLKAISSGVGRKKCFGAGMLLVM